MLQFVILLCKHLHILYPYIKVTLISFEYLLMFLKCFIIRSVDVVHGSLVVDFSMQGLLKLKFLYELILLSAFFFFYVSTYIVHRRCIESIIEYVIVKKWTKIMFSLHFLHCREKCEVFVNNNIFCRTSDCFARFATYSKHWKWPAKHLVMS